MSSKQLQTTASHRLEATTDEIPIRRSVKFPAAAEPGLLQFEPGYGAVKQARMISHGGG